MTMNKESDFKDFCDLCFLKYEGKKCGMEVSEFFVDHDGEGLRNFVKIIPKTLYQVVMMSMLGCINRGILWRFIKKYQFDL